MRELSLVALLGILIAVASLVVGHGLQGVWILAAVAHGLWSSGSVLAAFGLSCPTACGIILDPGIEPQFLHWQVDS